MRRLRSRVRRLAASDFARQSTGATVWNFGGMAFTLINGVLTSRLLAPDERGVLALILTVSSLSYLVSSLGTNTAVRVFQIREPWASFKTYFLVSSKLLVLNAVLVGLTTFAFARFGIVDSSGSFLIMAALGIVTFASSQLLDVLNAAGLVSRSAAVDNMGHLSTLVVLALVLVSSNPGRLSLVLSAYVVGFGARVFLSLAVIRKERVAVGGVSPDRGRTLVKQGVRFWGINLAQTLTTRADQIMLASLSTTYAVGIYAVAGAPASLMQVVSNSIGQMALREAAAGLLTVKRLVGAAGVALTVTGLYSLIMWAVAPVVIPFVFGSDYRDAVSVVRILLLAELVRSPYLVLIRALAGFNRPFTATASSIIGFPTLIVSMVLLVPNYGVEGAAFSVVITSTLLLAATTLSILFAFRSRSSR